MQALPNPQEAGPSPALRAVVGLLLGAAMGALAALIVPRRSYPQNGRSSHGQPVTPTP